MASMRDRVDLWLRLVVSAMVLVGCYFVLEPFMTAIMLAAILSVVSWPLYETALQHCGRNSNIAASLMVLLMVVTVLIPLSILAGMIAHQIPEMVKYVTDWVAQGMPIPAWVSNIPYIGPQIDEALEFGYKGSELAGLVQKAVDPVTKWVLSVSFGIGNVLFQIALVAFIVFFFYRDGRSIARRVKLFLDRISGGLAQEFADILVNTTRSVCFGVIGTAIGQGIVAGIGFYIADVPGIIMLSITVTVLSVVPVGPPLVWGPVALWLYAGGSGGWALFIVLWGLLAVSSVDNFLKPILISRGTSLPLALVFLGVFGGIISFGFLGLVLGPILLASGIAMFGAWVKNPVSYRGAGKIFGREQNASLQGAAGDGNTPLPEQKQDKISARDKID